MSIDARESERVRFVVERDGIEKALIFCENTINAYNSALQASHDGVNAYGKIYKRELDGSISYLENFIYQSNARGR